MKYTGKLPDLDLPEVITETMVDWTGRLQTKLQNTPYPPARGDYDRTYGLASGWRVTKVGPEDFKVENVEPYSALVVMEGQQAWMHEGRWWTVQGEIANLMPDLVSEIQERVYG